MTPDPNQRGRDGPAEYDSEAEKFVAQKSDRTIAARIRGIVDVEVARDYHIALSGEDDRPEELQRMAAKRLRHLQDLDGGQPAARTGES